jgi:MinD superfamily P-loop ATPase
MKPVIETSESVTLPVPVVDMSKCSLCGKCGEVCRYSAILPIGKQVLTFPEMCHGCAGCWLLCPEGAIAEGAREIGVRETGFSGPVEFVQGRLRVGEAMSPPLIKAVKKKINPDKIAILDAPPGASCPVIHTVAGTDFIILVTEPTPFGLHDLKIAVEALAPMGIPCGTVLNRSDIGDRGVNDYCATVGIPLLAELHDSRKIAEGYAKGDLVIESEPSLAPTFLGLLGKIEEIVSRGGNGGKEALP